MTDQVQQSIKQPSLSELGSKIREERNKRHLTLEAVSNRTGAFKKPHLAGGERKDGAFHHNIEKDRRNIWFQRGELFFQKRYRISNNGWEYPQPPSENHIAQPEYIKDVQVVRSDRRKRFALPGSNVMYDLTTPDMNRQMELLHMVVEAGGEPPEMNPWLICREKK